MKIVFYMTTGLEHGGGFEQFLIRTAKGLQRHANITIDIITMDDRTSNRIEFLLGLYYLRPWKTTSLLKKNDLQNITDILQPSKYEKCTSFKELRKKLNQYDLVYAKNEILEAIIFKFFLGYSKIPPVVFSCGTPIYYPVTSSISARLHNFIYLGSIYKYFTSGASGFHAKNSTDAGILKKMHSNKPIEMIYNPVDGNDLRMKAQQYIYDHSFDTTMFNIFWAGRLTEQKGVDDLLQIIERINSSPLQGKVVWNIAGDGELRKNIEDLTLRWNNVKYLGYVSPKYMPYIYQKNNLFLSTSKWEGSPNTIAEALVMHTPVIAYSIPGPRDILKGSNLGTLVETMEEFISAIQTHITNPQKIFTENEIVMQRFDQEYFYNVLYKLFLVITRK